MKPVSPTGFTNLDMIGVFQVEFKNFLLEVREDGIAVFTAHRPEKLNAMSAEAWTELYDFFYWAHTADEVKAIILTGSGEKAFIAGADLNSLATKTSANCLTNLGEKANNMIENCAKPVVCAVNGYAFGGGCEIAIACDFRIVSDNALFALPETSLGILPGAGGCMRLSRLVGLGRAKDIALLGNQVTAAEAVQIGLATKCVPQAELMDEAVKMCKKLIKRAPISLRIAKQVLNNSWTAGQETATLLECLALSSLCGTEDKQEGVTSFLEKRKPSYNGR